MEVEIISKEKVKPSSPTPPHLQIYKFSLLDQIALPSFYPVVLYFLPDPESDSTQKIHILKESLSSNLTRFYPFAGIINDGLSMKCNDEGIPFSIANVKGDLQDFLSQPDSLMIAKFLPIDQTMHMTNPGDHACMIQVNCFECGGMAISILVAHPVADGTTLATFLRGWAAAARSADEDIRPKFIGQDLFPSTDAMESESKLYSFYYATVSRSAKFVTRRYLFDASAIAKLKERATSSDDASATAKPTSVEVISALIWKCYMKIFADKSNLQEPIQLTHQVNLRKRSDPALPDESFGNYLWMAATESIKPTTDTSFKDLVSEVSRAIRKIDNKFVEVMQNDGYYEIFAETRKGLLTGANKMTVTSWCKFGLYDVDFGWGKPIWLSSYLSQNSESEQLAEFVTLMDTRSGDGIEAWMIIDEKYVAAFEEDEDLHDHVLINPSALDIGKKI